MSIKQSLSDADTRARFTSWLSAQGAEVLAPTNSHELIRFRAKGAVHILYRNAAGSIRIPGSVFCEAFSYFKKGAGWDAGATKVAIHVDAVCKRPKS